MSVKFKPTQIAMPLSANYGRWYAKMMPTGTVTSHQLADEIAHSTTATYADTLAVLNELSVVLRMHLLNSDRVEIGRHRGLQGRPVHRGRQQRRRLRRLQSALSRFVTLLHCYMLH